MCLPFTCIFINNPERYYSVALLLQAVTKLTDFMLLFSEPRQIHFFPYLHAHHVVQQNMVWVLITCSACDIFQCVENTFLLFCICCFSRNNPVHNWYIASKYFSHSTRLLNDFAFEPTNSLIRHACRNS